MRSWSSWFGDAVRVRRFVRKMEPHVAWLWRAAFGKKFRLPLDIEISAHAPWLNGEGIAYRKSLGRPSVNGFYVQ
jgi:hypothetical protein